MTCFTCHREFQTMTELLTHGRKCKKKKSKVAGRPKPKPYRCPCCDKWFRSKQDWKQKATTHGQNKTCSLCNKTGICNIGMHLALEHCKCLDCGKWFLGAEERSAHGMEAQSKCSVCEATLCAGTAAAHMRSKHPGFERCEMVGCKQYRTADQRDAHLDAVHLCTICKAYVPSKESHHHGEQEVKRPKHGDSGGDAREQRCGSHPRGTSMSLVRDCRSGRAPGRCRILHFGTPSAADPDE